MRKGQMINMAAARSAAMSSSVACDMMLDECLGLGDGSRGQGRLGQDSFACVLLLGRLRSGPLAAGVDLR